MVVQVLALHRAESTHGGWCLRIHTHHSQGIAVCDGRDDHLAVVRKRDEAAIEEVVDGRGQQEAVLSVQPFFIAGIPPGLAVARPQVFLAGDVGDAARMLNCHHSAFEQALPSASQHDGCALRFLIVWGERTQIEAFPRRAPRARVEALAAAVIDVLDFTRPRTEDGPETVLMTMADEARRLYAQLYQAELNQELGSALVDSLLERRAPMLLRLAMVFALSNRQWLIQEEHIEAAMAWVKYATDSVGFVLAGSMGSPSQPQVAWAAERISAFLAAKGSASRRDLVVDCFGRHQPAAVVDAAIAHLLDNAPPDARVEVHARSQTGPGRPATIYRLIRPRSSK